MIIISVEIGIQYTSRFPGSRRMRARSVPWATENILTKIIRSLTIGSFVRCEGCPPATILLASQSSADRQESTGMAQRV